MADDRKDGGAAVAEANRATSVDFIVEVADPKNRNVYFPITNDTLRGRWTKENLVGVTMDERFSNMPNIPGQVIAVRGRVASVSDPLAIEANRRLLKRAVAVIKAAFQQTVGPTKEKRVERLTDDELKNWCYWVRRLVDDKKVIIISGSVPEMDDIFRMKGQIASECHNTSAMTHYVKARKEHRYVPPDHPDTELDGEDDRVEYVD